jgi:phosphoglycerate dehydrogenase-like enzyme
MRPRVVVLAPAALFRSFFDPPRKRRLSRGFRWQRIARSAPSAGERAVLRNADALVTTWDSPRFGEELVDVAPRLRLIAHCGGEVKGRFARGLFSRVTIANAPGPMAFYVAELAVAFLLQAARRLDEHREALRRPSNRIYELIHTHGGALETLRGRTVGLVGLGRIGRELARLLRPFGARLLVHDPYVPRAARRAYCRIRSEFLVLAAALTPETRGLFDARRLSMLRDGATVVNVGRGGLVDLEALTSEVRHGRLRCALDVTDPLEPLPPRHPLRRMRGAALTPHVGAASRVVRLAMADIVLDTLERFFRGERLGNRVTTAMLDRMT